MTTLVLDTGALIALDHNQREVWALLRIAVQDSSLIQVPAGVIAQAWRDGSRQALLSQAISRCDEVALDGPTARTAGLICGRTATSDVIDASVAITAAGASRRSKTTVLTSDPQDIGLLLQELGAKVSLVTV